MKHNVVEKARSSNTCPVHDIIWQTTAIIPDVQVEKERLLWVLLPYPIEKIIYKIYDLRIGPQIITSQEDSHAAYIFH